MRARKYRERRKYMHGAEFDAPCNLRETRKAGLKIIGPVVAFVLVIVIFVAFGNALERYSDGPVLAPKTEACK